VAAIWQNTRIDITVASVDTQNSRSKVYFLKGIKANIGVMFKNIKEGEIYVLDVGKEEKEIIHTFFCLKPIDIFIFDSNFNLIEMHKNVKPFRIIVPKRKFRYVVEGLNLDLDKIREEVQSSLFSYR